MSISKILVVDDAAADRLNLQKLLLDAGFQVSSASSGKEAIERAASEKPDLVFMDVVMDEMDGYQACRKIKNGEDTSHIPVIMVTSKNQPVDKIWAERKGASAFISKPYTSEDIMTEISKLQ